MAGRPPQYSALRRAFGAVFDWAVGKKAVGKDAMGNVYYRWFEGSGPDRVERREVQWVSAYMYYDPKDVPPEWRMWLRKQRDDPPTEAEMQQNAAKQAALQSRVAALEEAERLRRLRQQAVGTSDQHAGPQPDMARFLQQMTGAAGPAAAAATTTQPPASSPSSARPAGAGAGVSPGRGTAEAGAAAPSCAEAHTSSSSSSSSSGSFQPETWRPGS